MHRLVELAFNLIKLLSFSLEFGNLDSIVRVLVVSAILDDDVKLVRESTIIKVVDFDLS